MVTMKKTIAAVLSAVLCTAALSAQTSSFEVLNIGTGGISSSLANATASELGSIEGAFYNPATLGSLTANIAVVGSYNPYLSMSIASGIFAARFGAISLAASGYGLIFDPIIGYITYNGDPGRVLASGDYVFGGSAALSFGTMLSLPFLLDIGMSVRYAYEVLDTDSLSALIGDVGVILGFRKIFGEDTLSFGVYGKNIGLPLSSPVAISLPTAIIGGLSYRFEPRKFLVGFKLLFDGAYYFNDTMKFNLGGSLELFKIVSIRAGYMFGYDIRGFTLGAGAHVPIGGMSLSFDYALVPMGDLGMHHSLQLGVAFGTGGIDPSRDAFDKGEAFLTGKRYRDAVAQFSAVDRTSPLYESSRAKMTLAQTALITQEKFEEGERLFAAGNYAEAVSVWQNVTGPEYSTRARDGIARAQSKMTAESPAATPAAAMPTTAAIENVKSYEDVYIEAVSYAKEKNYLKAIELWKTIPAGSELYERAQKSIEKANTRIAQAAEQ